MRARLAEERGVTLVELMIAMTISLAAFGLVLGAVEIFVRDAARSQRQMEAQDVARSTMDRLATAVRNAIAGPGAVPSVIEVAGPYDLVFQTVDPLFNPATAPPGSTNAAKAMRQRYCLDASTPSNARLWRQEQRWTTPTAPAVPSTAACPGTGWDGAAVTVARNLTNRIGGQNRPVWCYAPATVDPANPCPPLAPGTTPAKITSLTTNLVVDVKPSAQRGERALQGGVSLRNANRPPVAAFTVNQLRGFVIGNGSASSDDDGDSLRYQWYVDDVKEVGQTAPQFERSGLIAGRTYQIRLEVTDAGGLTGTTQAPVTVVAP